MPTPSPSAAHQDDVVLNLPPPENKRFYPAIDGLRGLAVLMVFGTHYLGRLPFLGWGFTGVNIFFVLSGFLITGILFDTRHAQFRFRTFYIRRTLRIFPLYYAVLLVALLLTPVFHWVFHPAALLLPVYMSNFARIFWAHDALTRPFVVDHLLATRPAFPPFALFFGHFWSLAIEEQFYLVWPFVVFAVKDRVRLRNLCLLSLPVCILGRALSLHFLPTGITSAGFIDRFTPFRIDSLLLGGFLALALRGPEASRIARLARPLMATIAAIALALELHALLTTHHLFLPYSGDWFASIGFTLIDLFAAALLLRTIAPGTRSFRLLSNAHLRRLGQISYGFYVFHDIPHLAYERLCLKIFGANTHHIVYPATAAVAFVSTIAIAWLSFRFFESPFLRLKERFTVPATR